MQKIRYWLLLQIAKMPKAFTYGAGVLIALALLSAATIAIVWLDRSKVAQRHDEAIRVYQVLSAESEELLHHLFEHDTLDCSSEALLHLNAHLMQSRYIREIGLLDESRRLICSTALGRLDEPFKGSHPVHVLKSGLELLNNIPLILDHNKQTAVIVQRPPFSVVISPYATGDIYASADAAWLHTADGLLLLDTAAGPDAVPAMRERVARRQSAGFSLHGLSYELVTAAPSQDLVLQTRRGLGTIVRQSGLWFPILLAGSLLIAVLSVGTIAPYVARLCNLRNRIGFLCDEAHLALVYQPVFDLATLQPVGCEVLARLKEGQQAWMPDQIIPAILGAGLESRFDHAVTRKAIRELGARLPAWKAPFTIALNYFPGSMGPDELIPVVAGALESTGRKDLTICIEITEHSLSSGLITEVQQLKAQGFLIAVDDFGTGYSNLRSVTGLSPDLLKIDRSFVYELEDAAVRSSLIPEIVNIARAVNAQTVAEGIENPEQARLLAAAGVCYGQGYALAPPMDMAQFIAFIKTFT